MKQFLQQHKGKLFAALFFFFVLQYFRVPISGMLYFLFVSPIFSGFESSLAGDLVLALIITMMGYLAIRRLKTSQLFNFGMVSVLVYLTQRWNPFWYPYPTNILSKVTYMDVLALTIVICTILKFFVREKPLHRRTPSPDGFIEDLPISTTQGDFFGRTKVAQQIASVINKTYPEKSFAIGVLGAYGSGKTSFINLLNSSLEDQDSLVINFNPWGCEKPGFIQQDFFDLLAEKLSAVNPDFTSLFYSYSRKLSRTDDQWAAYINKLNVFSIRGSDSIYEKINAILVRSGKKIIITIDDLDRLYSEEILEVLRLIRNTADFSNFFYIVAYEKSYVQSAVKSLNETASANYLDKIFQMEIPLPKREESHLLDLLIEKLSPALSSEHYQVLINTIIPSGFNNIYEPSFAEIFRHARDIVKFINGFKIAYSMIGKEVDFENLFILELLKFRYPVVYDHFYEHHEDFIYRRPGYSSHESFFIARAEPRLEKTNSFEVSNITEFYKWAVKQKDLSEKDASLLDTLFRRLFTGAIYSFPEAKNGISYPLYFQIYFRYRLAAYDVSDQDYRYAVKHSRLFNFIYQCLEKGLHEQILTRLLQEDFAVKRFEYEKLVRAIFYLGPAYIAKTSYDQFPYKSLIDILSNYHGQRVGMSYDNEAENYHAFIKSLFDSAPPDFVFYNELIYHFKEHNTDFPVSGEDLVRYQISFFQRMVESSHGFSQSTMQLIWGSRREVQIPVGTEGAFRTGWEFEPGLKSIIKTQLPNHDPSLFLKSSVKKDRPGSDLASIYNQFIALFDDPQELRDIVSGHRNLKDELKTEYLLLFDRCREVSFAHVVNFEENSVLLED